MVCQAVRANSGSFARATMATAAVRLTRLDAGVFEAYGFCFLVRAGSTGKKIPWATPVHEKEQ